MKPVKIATWSEVPDRKPVGALVGNTDLVIVRWDDNHSVMYGRCLHRGAMLADGHTRLDQLCIDDLTTFDREMAALTGIGYGGVE